MHCRGETAVEGGGRGGVHGREWRQRVSEWCGSGTNMTQTHTPRAPTLGRAALAIATSGAASGPARSALASAGGSESPPPLLGRSEGRSAERWARRMGSCHVPSVEEKNEE